MDKVWRLIVVLTSPPQTVYFWNEYSGIEWDDEETMLNYFLKRKTFIWVAREEEGTTPWLVPVKRVLEAHTAEMSPLNRDTNRG